MCFSFPSKQQKTSLQTLTVLHEFLAKMASVAHFYLDADNIIHDIESRNSASEECAVDNFLNARTIQRTFRGYISRKHVALLHEKATCIQKNWRAFTDRIAYRILLKKKFDEMCWTYYNYSATTIQKWWKGYWTRSKIFSYYRLKDWLAFVMEQNLQLKCSAEICQSNSNAKETQQREDEAKEWIIYILFKLHHLLRTHQLSGIYSLPNTTELSDIEKMLKCLKYTDFMIFYNNYMEDVRRAKAKEMPPYILQKCKYLGHFEREYYEHVKSGRHNPYIGTSRTLQNTDDIDGTECCRCFCTNFENKSLNKGNENE